MELKWQFGEPIDVLEKEIYNILEDNYPIEDLLFALPAEIHYNDVQTAKLCIHKLGDIVWQITYDIFLDPGNKNFEKRSIISVTKPSIKLALYEMRQELINKGMWRSG